MNTGDIQTAASLIPGEKAVVTGVQVNGLLYRRLLDLGFVENAVIECVHTSPAGDPTVFQIRGANVALRKKDASMIMVDKSDMVSPGKRATPFVRCTTCPGHAQHTGAGEPREGAEKKSGFIVALAGNPNTGKSTLFNALTGLRQHVGNWPGKTVSRLEGRFSHEEKEYRLIDLPGSYSLLASSIDEEIARDFVLFGQPDCTVVVVDGTCLERNLNLVLQILQITTRVVVCVNLLDEARRKGIQIDLEKLREHLGVPVIGTEALRGKGLLALKEAIADVVSGEAQTDGCPIDLGEEYDSAVAELVPMIRRLFPDLPNPGWIAMRLIDGGDKRLIEELCNGTLSSAQGRIGTDSLPDGMLPDEEVFWHSIATGKGDRK